jgi:hypothetical protein
MVLLIAVAGAVQAAPVRPALPRGTFVRVELSKFPTYSEPCIKATKTLRVPSNRYRDIPSALLAATSFTRIVIAAGVYNNSLSTYPSPVDIKVNDLCLQGAGTGRTRIVGMHFQNSNAAPWGIKISSDRVVVSGLSIEGFMVGLFLGRADGQTQRNVTVTNVNIIGRPDGVASGLNALYDHRATQVPVVDGLLLSNITMSNVNMGVSCDSGPCEHWWAENLFINCSKGEGWGADAFAIESGRQIVVTGTTVAYPTADGIDVKGSDVVVSRCTVINTGSNGIKLWQGGDVLDCTIDGTGDYREAIVGSQPGRYRYQRLTITNHCKNGKSYLGSWGYGTTTPTRVEFRNCTFRNNPNSGGFCLPEGSVPQLTRNVFGDVGRRLLQIGITEQALHIMTDAAGLAEVERRGWGSGNRLG